MPKPLNTHSDTNWVLHPEEPWLLVITHDSTILVYQSECFLRVRKLVLWFPSHFCPTADRARYTSVALPWSSSIWSCSVGSLANQVASASPFKECSSGRLGREGSILCPSCAKGSSCSQAELGCPANTLLSIALLSLMVAKVILACAAFGVRQDLTINRFI